MQEAIRHGGRADGRPTRGQIEPAARTLVERHSMQLIATARRYSLSAEDAEDAYQRGLEILLTKAPSVNEDDLVPWLKTVVKHEAFAIRKQRQRAEIAGDPDLAGGLAPAAHEQAERHERLRVGVEAMSHLKPQELRCLLLRAEGYSYKQICDETGWTYTKVNRCVNEGRKAFLDRVAGIESGAECQRMSLLLSRLVDGEASAEDVALLRPHLRTCLACRATLRDYRETPARVAAFAPLLVGPHLLARGLRRLQDLLGFLGAHKTAAVLGVAAALAGGAAVHTVDRGDRAPGVEDPRTVRPLPPLASFAQKPPAAGPRPAASHRISRPAAHPRAVAHGHRAPAPSRPAAVQVRSPARSPAPSGPAPAEPVATTAPSRKTSQEPVRTGGGSEFGP